MNNGLFFLKKIGAFKGSRKFFFEDFFLKKGFNCFIKNNEIILGDNSFLAIINDDSVIFKGKNEIFI